MDAVMANIDGGGGATGGEAGVVLVGVDDPRRAPAPTPPPTPAVIHTAKKTAVSAKKRRRVHVSLVSALIGEASSGRPARLGAESMTTCFGPATGTTTIAAVIW